MGRLSRRGVGGEKLGIKLKLSFSWGLGLAELGKNEDDPTTKENSGLVILLVKLLS